MRQSAPGLRAVLAAALVIAGAAASAPLSAQQGQAGQGFSVTVDSIAVVGNDRVPASRIVQESEIRVGSRVSYPAVQNAIRRLFATGDFSDVQILVAPRDPAVFYIRVEERPFITRYGFQGLEDVGAGSVRDTAGLVEGEPLNPASIARAREVLSDRLSNEGFPRARIDTALVPDGRGHRLVFRVDQGARLGLASVAFRGNDAFTDAELRGAMSTGEEGFFWFQSGELHRDAYERDLQQRLPDFYNSHGYIDFSVVGDTVVVDTTTGKGRVAIEVDEGPRYVLRDFRIRGNREFPAEVLRLRFDQAADRSLDSLPADSLPAFDQVAFESGTGDVGEFYRNAGYLRARVVPTVERIPAGDSTGGRPAVRAIWHVEEGDPAYIHHVDIVGNDHTHERIIRQRLTLLPGDVYSQQRLINSVRSIQNIGFFEQLPPQEMVNISERSNGDVDIELRVKEKSTGNLNFGMSASAGTGLAGFIGYEQPNLFGQAKSGRFRWLFGGRAQDIEVSYSDPGIMGSQYSGSIQLRSSRDQFRTFSLGERRQTGGSVEFGVPFPGLRATRFYVGYSYFSDETKDLRLLGVDPGARGILLDATRSTAHARLVRDTRQGSPFPLAGARHAFSARFSGGALGGDGDFGKYEFESEWFVPLAQIGGGFESNPIQITGGLSFNGGFIVGNNPFFRERYFMGGTQVGEQLRGYEEGTVTPQGHVPRNAGGFSDLDRVGESFFTTSATVGAKLTGSVYVNTFLDAGNVWSSANQFNPMDLLTGAGVGVSLVTPFGPVGLDYAYGFDRRDVLGRSDPGWKLHFKFGRMF